ncbi:hypothetical protein JZ751_014155, partial [Albula glossodonta]
AWNLHAVLPLTAPFWLQIDGDGSLRCKAEVEDWGSNFDPGGHFKKLAFSGGDGARHLYLAEQAFLRTSSSTLPTLLTVPSVMMNTWRGLPRCMGCWYTQERAPRSKPDTLLSRQPWKGDLDIVSASALLSCQINQAPDRVEAIPECGSLNCRLKADYLLHLTSSEKGHISK